MSYHRSSALLKFEDFAVLSVLSKHCSLPLSIDTINLMARQFRMTDHSHTTTSASMMAAAIQNLNIFVFGGNFDVFIKVRSLTIHVHQMFVCARRLRKGIQGETPTDLYLI